jgi:hypothetical protein
MMRIALLAVFLAACNGGGKSAPDAFVPPDISPTMDAMPRQTVMESITLVPTELVEARLTGGPGDIAGLRLMAPAAELDWNIHGHANGGTQVVDEALNQMLVEYVFQPTSQADWYLLLRNSGPTDMTIQVRIELFGAITWSGWI